MRVRLLAITPPSGAPDPAIVDAWAAGRELGLALLLRRPGRRARQTLADPDLQPLRARARAEGMVVLLSCHPDDTDGWAAALDAGLDGVQLRADPGPGTVAAARAAGFRLVGASMHAPAPAVLPPADYLCVAPIFAPRTESPGAAKTAAGLAALGAFTGRGADIVALGGVTPMTAPACLLAGATGLASIRSFFGPTAEVADNVASLVAALARAGATP